MRPDMVLRLAYHSALSSSLFRTVEAMRAPCAGGLDQLARTRILSWLATAWALLASLEHTCTHPVRSLYRPRFLEKDWQMRNGMFSDAKWRMDALSNAGSPDAKPWYAESKMQNSLPALQMSAICFHCSRLQSTPVGLWAHAWSTNVEPGAAAFMSSTMASKSRPRVSGL